MPWVGVAAGSLLTSGKFAVDPELRGAEFERITQNLDVHFWKSFWNLTETQLLAVSIRVGSQGLPGVGGSPQPLPDPCTPCSRWPAWRPALCA